MEPYQVLSRSRESSVAGELPGGGTRVTALSQARRVLASSYWPVVLALGAMVVSVPAVKTKPLTDDFIHGAMRAGSGPFTDRLAEVDLARQNSGELWHVLAQMHSIVQPEVNLGKLKAYGALPWWTSEGFRVAFWRPVASLTHWLDYRLFPQSFPMMHVHNILWFAAMILAVSVLYRRIAVVGWVGGLAALMYLLDDSSYFPTMWVANRNLLISVLFGVLTLIAYDRWRTERWRPGAVLASVFLLVSLLAAEAGVATLVYLFAYELALGRGRLVNRAVALAPSAGVLVLWRLAYNVQGYGANGGGFYLDPVREPVGYVLAMLERAPFFLGGQWTGIPADIYSFLPTGDRRVAWAFLIVLTILLPVLLLKLLRHNRRARFWLIGMYLSALPFCASVPMSRTLLFVAIGAFGLFAEILGGWVRSEAWVPVSGWGRRTGLILTILLFIAHVPSAIAGRIGGPAITARMEREMASVARIRLTPAVESQDLVIVNAPNPSTFLHDPFRRAYEGRPLPRRVRMLVPGFGPLKIIRTGPRQMTVRSLSGSLFDCEQGHRMDFVFFYRFLSDVRGAQHPFHAGDRVSMPPIEVEVRAVDKRGSPVEVAFEFDVPLDDASLKWLQWNWDRHRYEPFRMPAIGQAVKLAGPF